MDIAVGLGRGRGINLIEVLVLLVVAIMIFGLGLGYAKSNTDLFSGMPAFAQTPDPGIKHLVRFVGGEAPHARTS